MKNIFVHVHIYYENLWPQLKACLENIQSDTYDLYITLSVQNSELEKDILEFNPNARILIVENLGFDVGPFIHVLSLVDLSRYQYIIKLHSKREMPFSFRLGKNFALNVSGPLWREYLLSFISYKSNFEKCLKAFDEKPKLGMCAYHFLIRRKWMKDDYSFLNENKKMISKMGLELREPFSYVMGTMFMARASLFVPLQKLGLKLSDFELSQRKKQHSLAHSMERLLGLMIGAQGYDIEDHFTEPNAIRVIKRGIFLQGICKIIYKNEITGSGKKIIELCGIRIYSKKMNS